MMSLNEQQTPLHYAAKYGSKEMIEVLIVKFKVEKEARDVFNRTPLYLAAEYGIINLLCTIINIKFVS